MKIFVFDLGCNTHTHTYFRYVTNLCFFITLFLMVSPHPSGQNVAATNYIFTTYNNNNNQTNIVQYT